MTTQEISQTNPAADKASTDDDRSRAKTLMVCGVVTLLAGCLRFYGLGEWSFANDELATFVESDRLFGSPEDGEFTIYDVLPRLIPTSYAIHESGYQLFGREEFGSRTMPAIFGTLHVAMVFLLGTRLHGRRFGLILSSMVALWPEHIFHSQQNRFYMFAMCGSTLAFFLATLGLQQSSKKHLIGALVVAALSVTTHTLATGLAPMFYFAILASLVVCRAKVSRRFTVNGLSVVALVVAFVLFYALPNIRGNWTGGVNGWMYSPVHALMTIPGSLGWGVIVLSLTGSLLLAAQRQPQHIFVFLCTAAVVPFALLVPFAVNFHPEYLMIVIFPALYSAAWFVHVVTRQLEEHSKTAAFTFVVFAALSNFPTLVSYYVDGSRPNFRLASEFLMTHSVSDDNIAAISIGNLRHYHQDLPPTHVIDPVSPIASISEVVSESGRTWIVIQSGRSGIAPSLQEWLNRTCRLEKTIHKKRFDYYANRIDIFSTDSSRLMASLAETPHNQQTNEPTWFQSN
jgi:predicted membrane-bound mannosyltransferase